MKWISILVIICSGCATKKEFEPVPDFILPFHLLLEEDMQHVDQTRTKTDH